MKVFSKYKALWILTGLLFLLIVIFLVFEKINKNNTNGLPQVQSKLARIKEARVLKAVVDYNSTNYFIYRGTPMGFQYELLQLLCEDLGVSLEIVVSNNLDETFEGIKNGQFDLVAKNLTVTRKRRTEVDFTIPLMHTRQVLVQRKMTGKTSDTIYVNGTRKLAGKKVYVQKNTSYYRRLLSVSKEIENKIEIVEDTVYGVEQLVERVANGEIDFTVCDENVALLNKTYYPNLDVSLRISFPQNISWAVQRGSPEWKGFLNNWIANFKHTRKYGQLYHKYFESPRIAQRMESNFHSIYGGNISPYDNIIKEVAKEYQWDWRLIASIMYHESRFNKDAGSWAGAYGLMQIMPSTAEAFGIVDFEEPKQNIKVGILFLNWLKDRFVESITDSEERLNFVLAAYNVGYGHVLDAQRLAEKYGKNPLIWRGNVDFYLKNKSVEKFYNDSVVQYGYCRGEEATEYVKRVTGNYRHYINLISE